MDPMVAGGDAPPDWAALEEEIRCPMCDYNLRGLPEPRCPECGYRFQRRQLTDPTLRRHPYLFEHPPEGNWRSFWRTVWGGRNPWPFWSTLHPTQPSPPGRLVMYWLIVAAIAAIPLPAECLRLTIALLLHIGSARGQIPLSWIVYPAVFHNKNLLLFAWIGCLWLIWPWLTFATLMIFTDTMERVKVRPAHVLRCVIYTVDTMLWTAMAGSVAILSASLLGSIDVEGVGTLALLAGLATYLAMGVRLAVAYRRYMRFDLPELTILASQIIVVLSILAVALVLPEWLVGLLLR